MTSTFTTNLNLELVPFNQVTWHDAEHSNWEIVDAAIGALGLTGLTGVWENSTLYTVGQIVVDTVTFTIWQVSIGHTSAVAPTTFAADRVAHPTYWTQLNVNAPTYLATVNDVTNLGSAVARFANLFLKSGGTINFGNSDYIITHSTGSMAFGGAVTITGAVRIGATVPQGPATLSVVKTGSGIEFGHTSTAGFRSSLGADVAGYPWIIFSAESGTTANTYRTRGNKGSIIRGDLAGGFSFETIPTASADNQTATVTATLTTAGVLGLPFGQITFPATQNPSAGSNTFDDYEEGTFTPSIQFGGASTGITYSRQFGAYTKIGNRALFQVDIILTSKGSSTGGSGFAGMPFTAEATAGNTAICTVKFANMTGLTGVMIAGKNNGDTVGLFYQTSATGTPALLDTAFTATSQVIFSGHYSV